MRQGSVTVCCCASFHSVSSPGRCSKFSLGRATRFGHSVITGLTLEGPQSWNLLFSIWKKKKESYHYHFISRSLPEHHCCSLNLGKEQGMKLALCSSLGFSAAGKQLHSKVALSWLSLPGQLGWLSGVGALCDFCQKTPSSDNILLFS